MKNKMFLIASLIAATLAAIGGEAKTVNNRPVQLPGLPDKVIDPKTYQDTTASIRYVNTKQLVQQGYRILEYAPPGTRNAAGYSLPYDPSLHKNVYMRIPKTGSSLYPGRW